MNKIIVPTGYMGSGSSAITDLLMEIDGFESPNGTFEYVFLHCPNGVFDLEDKLLLGNNSLRSDEALNTFYKEMQCLYSKKNYWVGNYKRHISPHYMEYVEDFIRKLCSATFNDMYWYYMQKPVTYGMQVKNYWNRMTKKLLRKDVSAKVPLQYSKMRIAFPAASDFYAAAKVFIDCVLNDLGIQEKNVIVDQLLLPHNLYRCARYFDENLRVIVVERDPRDVFILNKYLWHPQNNAVPYPLDAKDFAFYYKRLRMAERIKEDNRILRIYFEDLIYQYDQTVEKIMDFVGVDSKTHLKKKEKFDPAVSIKNTQLFRMNEQYAQEASVIVAEIPEYIYNFPETEIVRHNVKELF